MVEQCKCQYSAGIAFSCFFGFILSIYALNIEINAEENHKYVALCDISEKISCTKVFTSKYGRGLGLVAPLLGDASILNQPNSVAGVITYFIIGYLGFKNTLKASIIQVILCIITNILSCYLGYLLYFVLEDFCVVCVSTYVVNLINLILAVKRYNNLKTLIKVNDKKIN